MVEQAKSRIVCAALKYRDRLVVGPRHFDHVMQQQMDLPDKEATPGAPERPEQGFIDQHGNFWTRAQAWEIAANAKQVIRRVGGDDQGVLYSENLY